jgi:hypothetical protein
MRKARSLSVGDAYSPVKMTAAAISTSRLARIAAVGEAASHRAACRVTLVAMPGLIMLYFRGALTSGAAFMPSGWARSDRVREGIRTGSDKAIGSGRRSTVVSDSRCPEVRTCQA